MKSVSWCIVAAVAGSLWTGAVPAETPADYPGPASSLGPGAAAALPVVPTPKPRPGPRAPMYAAGAAATATRMQPQQREERRFLKEAAAASRFHADAARLALGKSSDPGVRSLAATFVAQQARSGVELLRMLHQRGMAAPMLENEQRRTLNRLGKLQGVRFDRQFLQEVALRSQQETVGTYEQASLALADPALRDWIARALPTLRSQVASAERIAAPHVVTRAAGRSHATRAMRPNELNSP